MSEPVDEPADSSAPPVPATPVRPAAGRQKPKEIPWRLIVLGAVVIYAVFFVILNSRQVPVSFVFLTVDVSLVVALVLALLIGFLGGYLFDALRTRKKKNTTAV